VDWVDAFSGWEAISAPHLRNNTGVYMQLWDFDRPSLSLRFSRSQLTRLIHQWMNLRLANVA
jgi:hypothetical protein